MNLDDTIVAISTPPGRGGLGVVRLAGPDARAIAAPLLRLNSGLEPNRAIFGELIEPGTQQRIDEVVVTYFAKPHSYTTDDIVEISAHGSPVVLRHIVELALARGARLADPGEFTMRAFLNGRLDLTQAEAVRDLIDSQTLYQARVAAQQLGGALSHRLAPIKQKLVELIATLEAGVDFAEDDVSVLPGPQIFAGIDSVAAPLRELCRSFAYGKLVHEGLTLAIVGRPNVGKSSLFNRLVERERAIVTAAPGTTRDLVTETVALGGIPVHLVDTAGIRQALNEAEAESIGIRKSREALADADLVLVVTDASQPLTREDHELIEQVSSRNAIVVGNKIDLADGRQPTAAGRAMAEVEAPGGTCPEVLRGGLSKKARLRDVSFRGGRQPDEEPAVADHWPLTADHLPTVQTSALTGAGIAELRAEILQRMSGGAPQQETAFLTNLRQQKLVEGSLAALAAAARAVESNTPHEMLLLDLYGALRPLDEITGATTSDDILNLIFSTFCIGK
ncbi:MAG: tRNA uridine-5-carboxymethylaminomethyl(34) synthesis GTPase MnmE [Terriglobales bacterium]